jgi:hypothetical protein
VRKKSTDCAWKKTLTAFSKLGSTFYGYVYSGLGVMNKKNLVVIELFH